MTSTSHFPHEVIRASAGTGKTFQLSNRFLGLASAGASADQILAATFARKAAGEILDRVLLRLAEGAQDPAKLEQLAGHIQDPALDRPRCLELLQSLVRRLHRLRIGTLDSFFLQMAGGFSLELGLPPGWQIVDELVDRGLRAGAIQAVLHGESTADLLTLMHLLTKGEATRSITSQISEIVNDLYELYCESSAAAWLKLPRHTLLTDDELREAHARLGGLPKFTNKNLAKAHAAHLENVERGDWEAFVSKGFVKAILTSDGIYYKVQIDSEVEDAYRPLIDHARAILVGQLANQNEATLRLLEKFDKAYERLKFTSRGLRFNDVTRKLAGGLAKGGLQAMSYRLDAHIAHLLLDEFQDTSLAQWEVVHPFAQHVTAEGSERSFFCVGDVKQAIYGWRGGVAEIFDTVGSQLEGITARSLTKSFRSSQVIIDVVNSCFENLLGNRALEQNQDVAHLWSDRFLERHTTAKPDLPGYCRLVAAPRAADGEKQDPVTLAFAAVEVARLARESPGRSIGVLVRRNQAVGRLIYELRTRQQIMASEEGGNPLTDSVAVQLILSLLRLADHPGDTTARFHVATSALGPLVGLERHDNDAAADSLAGRLREALITAGYGRTIYEWVQGLAPVCDSRELSRLLQLVELAYAYEADATLRTQDFIARVESKRVEDPTAADVRVMTVHQAKGLEFDIVVLPELDIPLKGQTPRVVVGRTGPAEPINLVCRYTNETVRSLLPEQLQALFERWSSQAVSDSLCLLYVALTRPVHALHLIVAPSAENEKSWPKTFSGVLRSAFADGRFAEPGAVLCEHGRRDWFQQLPPATSSAGGATEATAPEATVAEATVAGKSAIEFLQVRLREDSGRRERGLERQSPSGLEGGTHVDLSQRLRLDSSQAATRGTLVHAWLEQLEWFEGFEIDEPQLRRIAQPLLGSQLDFANELRQFRELLQHPAIRQALSRSAYEDPAALGFAAKLSAELLSQQCAHEVWRERTFAMRDGEALLTGAIDRVVVIRHKGKPVAADILDFKTDFAPDDAAIAAKVEYYRPQIAAYRRAVSRLTGLAPNRIAARLIFTGRGIVCPLTSVR